MTALPGEPLGERLLRLIKEVPALDHFPTVDQLVREAENLAAKYPDLITRRRIGTSRLGQPIYVSSVGGPDSPNKGPTNNRDARAKGAGPQGLVFAGVHPNEPIGGLTALHLLRTLASDPELLGQLGYTWHVVECIDPDGMRLNEGWFSASMSRGEYGRHFYRPAPNEQVEWTFPLSYKEIYFDRMMPETIALMRLIDEVQPTFMCSLHNGELGGVYYYLTAPAPELYPVLHQIPAELGIPLDVGEPESPVVPVLAPAIFGESSMSEAYEFAVNLGLDPTDRMDGGDSSQAYTAKYHTFCLISELPYWSHPDAANTDPTSVGYAEVLKSRAVGLRELGETLAGALSATEPDLKIDSPFLRATKDFTPHFVQYAEQEERRARLPESDRPATVAERFTGADLVHCFRLRYGGMMLRVLHAEIVAGNGTPAIRDEHARLEKTYEGWSAEAEGAYTVDTIPLAKLVGVQFGAILACAEYARSRFGPTSAAADPQT